MFGVNTVAQTDIILPAEPTRDLPAVRVIGLADLKDALAMGLDDFRAMPTHVIFLSVIYPIVGIALGAATLGYDVIPLLFPLAAGFALIGPLAAIGLYELSRRRELGLDTSWKHAFDIVHSPSIWGIAALGLLLLALFAVWLAVAHAIYVAAFGIDEPVSSITFARKVLTTPEGYRLIVVGNAVGFLFAVVAFVLSVVSFPLMLDRHVGVAAAIVTSIKVSSEEPRDHGGVGTAGRRRAGHRLSALLHRPCRGHAGTRPCDMAFVWARSSNPMRAMAGISPGPKGSAQRGEFRFPSSYRHLALISHSM